MASTLQHRINVASSLLASSVTLGRGVLVVTRAQQPEKPLRLYEFEACPFCRNVREVLTALHLDAEIYPCPKAGTRFRPEVLRLGGKTQFPFFVDPNRDTQMYESTDIIAYLFRTYADRDVPLLYRSLGSASRGASPLSSLASGIRGLRGMRVRPSNPSRAPRELLHLWSFEGSPFARPVREQMSELEIPYVLHNLGKERWSELGVHGHRLERGPYVPEPGGKRDEFLKKYGRVQVPYLEDPNTGTNMFESADIMAYLEQTYGG